VPDWRPALAELFDGGEAIPSAEGVRRRARPPGSVALQAANPHASGRDHCKGAGEFSWVFRNCAADQCAPSAPGRPLPGE